MGDGFFLTREGMEAYRAHYLPDPADWETSGPRRVLAEDLGAWPRPWWSPPASTRCATRAPPTPGPGGRRGDVEYRCYDDMVHGFFGMGVVPDCLALATEVCDAMGALMRRAARAADG